MLAAACGHGVCSLVCMVGESGRRITGVQQIALSPVSLCLCAWAVDGEVCGGGLRQYMARGVPEPCVLLECGADACVCALVVRECAATHATGAGPLAASCPLACLGPMPDP